MVMGKAQMLLQHKHKFHCHSFGESSLHFPSSASSSPPLSDFLIIGLSVCMPFDHWPAHLYLPLSVSLLASAFVRVVRCILCPPSVCLTPPLDWWVSFFLVECCTFCPKLSFFSIKRRPNTVSCSLLSPLSFWPVLPLMCWLCGCSVVCLG